MHNFLPLPLPFSLSLSPFPFVGVVHAAAAHFSYFVSITLNSAGGSRYPELASEITLNLHTSIPGPYVKYLVYEK